MTQEHEPVSVPCEICGVLTTMTSTKRCDNCWEIERRLRSASPEVQSYFKEMLVGDGYSMRCTANTMTKMMEVRCQRNIGHPGLHRVEKEGRVIEFPSSKCWFPHYSPGG